MRSPRPRTVSTEFDETQTTETDIAEGDIAEGDDVVVEAARPVVTEEHVVVESDHDGEPLSLDDVVVEATVVDTDELDDEYDDDLDDTYDDVVIDLGADGHEEPDDLNHDLGPAIDTRPDGVRLSAPVTQPVAPVSHPPTPDPGGMWFPRAEGGDSVDQPPQRPAAASDSSHHDWPQPSGIDIRSGAPPMPDVAPIRRPNATVDTVDTVDAGDEPDSGDEVGKVGEAGEAMVSARSGVRPGGFPIRP